MLTTDSRIIIWDTGSWDQTRTVSLRGREVSEASGLAFSPDGQLLAAAGGDGIVSIVEADTAKEIRRMRVPGGAFLGVTFSPDGTRVTAMPNFGGDIPVWDVATGRQLLSLPATGGSLDADYSPDGDEIATVNSEAGIEIWNAHEGGDPIRILEGHTGPVWGVEYSPDGTLLASAGDDGTARLWDTTTGKQVMALHGHSGTVFGVRFTPDGTRVLTAGSDGTLRLWDISPSGSREFLTLGHASEVSGVEYSPDGSRLLTLDNHAYARLWDASTGQVLGGAADVGEFQPDFSPDGSSFSAPSWAPAIRDSNTGRVLQNLPLSQGDWLLATAYSPDGSMIAGSLGDTAAPGTVLVWDASTGDQLRQLGQLASEYEAVKDLAYSPDGTVLAGMERTGLVRFWDAQSGDEVGTFKAQSANGTTVTFSRDGSLLATAGADGAILWDMPSGRKLMTLTGHSSAVADVAFSHDGRLVATVGQDQTARVWDVDTGREVITLYGHTAPLTGVAFSPDGTKLATSSLDGTARVYLLQTNDIIRLARSRLLRGFTDSECRQYLHLDSCPPSMAPAPAGPAPAASEPLGPEGAFRMTVTAKDLLGAGFPRKDVKYNVGDWTLSMSAGRFRLHQNHPSGYPWETSGSYVVEDGRIIFTDEDPGCFSTAISTRWRLRDQTLSFADTEELTPCGATGDYLATLGTLFESQDWSRVP
jgi:WD40 repeat protein